MFKIDIEKLNKDLYEIGADYESVEDAMNEVTQIVYLYNDINSCTYDIGLYLSSVVGGMRTKASYYEEIETNEMVDATWCATHNVERFVGNCDKTKYVIETIK